MLLHLSLCSSHFSHKELQYKLLGISIVLIKNQNTLIIMSAEKKIQGQIQRLRKPTTKNY